MGWLNQCQKEVSLLHQNFDGLLKQVQEVKEEVQNLKKTPCNYFRLTSKNQVEVEQDEAHQALQKDLEILCSKLTKLTVENEAASQRHERLLKDQNQGNNVSE